MDHSEKENIRGIQIIRLIRITLNYNETILINFQNLRPNHLEPRLRSIKLSPM